MNKNDLREKYKEIRNNVSDKYNKSLIICNNIVNTDIYKRCNTIGIYISFNSEVDTSYLIDYSLNIGKKVVVPVINNNIINFYEIDKNTIYKNNKYGIKEPIDNKINNNIDLIIVPGLCFNKEGFRIGYGKGYYDKFLSKNKCYKIGICFKEQITDKIIFDINDIPVDEIIYT